MRIGDRVYASGHFGGYDHSPVYDPHCWPYTIEVTIIKIAKGRVLVEKDDGEREWYEMNKIATKEQRERKEKREAEERQRAIAGIKNNSRTISSSTG